MLPSSLLIAKFADLLNSAIEYMYLLNVCVCVYVRKCVRVRALRVYEMFVEMHYFSFVCFTKQSLFELF